MKFSVRRIDILLLLLFLSVLNVFSIFSIYVEVVSVALIFITKVTRTVISRKNYYFIWMVLFLLNSILSIVWSSSSVSAAYGCRGLIECLFVGFAIHSYLIDEKDASSFLKIYVISAIILLIRIVILTPFSNILARELAGGLNANVVGLQFVIAVLSLVWLSKEKYVVSRIYYSLLLFLGVGVVISGSKKAIIALIVGLVIYRILYSNNLLSTMKRVIGVCIALYIIYYLCMNIDVLYEIVGIRFEGMIKAFTLGKDYGDASTFERLTLVDYAMKMWKESPLIGYGLNSFEYITPFDIYTHCNYVELLFGVGIFGTVLFYSVYLWMIKNSLRFLSRNKIFIFSIACLAIFLICDIGYVSYGDLFYHVIIAFICEMIAKIKTRECRRV